MTSYLVLEQAGPARGADGAAVRLVRDRFAWVAFLFPFFWLLWHRLWFAAAMVLLASVAVAIGAERLEAQAAGLALSMLIGLLVALEGPVWLADRLKREGYAETGVIEAGSIEEAELRFAETLAHQPEEPLRTTLKTTPVLPSKGTEPDLIFGRDRP